MHRKLIVGFLLPTAYSIPTSDFKTMINFVGNVSKRLFAVDKNAVVSFSSYLFVEYSLYKAVILFFETSFSYAFTFCFLSQSLMRLP